MEQPKFSSLRIKAGKALSDDDILARFTKKAAFAEWWADWSEDNRSAFLRIARAAHDAGLDWYHLNMARQVRCGRKKVGAIDATEVYAQIGGRTPYLHVRTAVDRQALDVYQVDISRCGFTDAAYIRARVEEIGGRLCNHCYTSPLTVAASIHWLSTCRDAFVF